MGYFDLLSNDFSCLGLPNLALVVVLFVRSSSIALSLDMRFIY
jgi:hypothetical protein